MNKKQKDWKWCLKTYFQSRRGNWVIDKKEVLKYNFDGNIPQHICEFLFAHENKDKKYSESHKKLLEDKILKYRPKEFQKQFFLNTLMNERNHKLFDQLEVTNNVTKGRSEASLPCLGRNSIVKQEVIDQNPEILERPVWGVITLVYLPPENRTEGIIEVINFIPVETKITKPSVVHNVFLKIVEAEPKKGIHIWNQILLATLGIDPISLDLSTEEGYQLFLNYLSRLIPHVYDNLFMIELGPPGTGKTTSVRKSPYADAIPISGTSRARLFYNQNTKKPGRLIGMNYIAIDDIQQGRNNRSFEESISSFLEFMNETTLGQISEAKPHFTGKSGCSVSFFGNTRGISTLTDPEQYFSNVPKEMRSAQFLDRINGFIDGHNFKKVANPWKGISLQGNIFGRFLYELRKKGEVKRDFQQWFDEPMLKLSNASSRCKHSIKSMSTALLMLIYPTYSILGRGNSGMKQPPKYLLEVILKYAISSRQNIRKLVSYSEGANDNNTNEIDYRNPIKYQDSWEE